MLLERLDWEKEGCINEHGVGVCGSRGRYPSLHSQPLLADAVGFQFLLESNAYPRVQIGL